MRIAAIYLVALGVLALQATPMQAGPLRICTKYEVVHLNEKLQGTVVDFTANHRADRRFYSKALQSPRDMYVYLPPGYDPTQAYPLMIWMHGFIQDEKDFLEIAPIFDKAIARGELPPMIIAAPDGSIRGRPSFLDGGSFYLNSLAGRFEDYLVVDVWNTVVERFAIRPEPEAHILAGASMGGFGAVNLGIKHRDRFKLAVGILPPVNLRYIDCRGRYFADFDPNCTAFAERYRPHCAIGRFYGGLITVKQSHLIDPLFGRDRAFVVESLKRENPTEMLEAYAVKPGELSMFLAYGTRDEFNIDAQVESFAFYAGLRDVHPKVLAIPNGKHDSATGYRAMPEFSAWLKPLILPYSPANENVLPR